MSSPEAFERFCGLLCTEDGAPFALEGWQREVVADWLAAQEALVLVSKGNGKTCLLAAYALFHLLSTANASAYVAAASRDQASLLFGYASGFVRRSQELQRHLEVKPGYRRIRARRDDGFLQVLSADADTADGVAPTLACVDELHRHKNDSIYGVMRDGLGKRGGQMVTISTAGFDEDSALGQLRAQARSLADVGQAGAHLVARSADGRFVMHEFSVPADGDVHDLKLVGQANPSSFVTLDQLRARHDSPSMRESAWRRFACGQWVRTEGESWLPTEAWDRLVDQDREVSECVLAFDGSFNQDSTALVGCTTVRRDANAAPAGELPHLFVVECWERPGEAPEDWVVPILDVEDTIHAACERFQVKEIAADPFRWQRSLEVLSRRLGKRRVVAYPQSPTRMVAATARLGEAVMNAQLTHDGDQDLRRHVANAVVSDRGRGPMLRKDSSRSRRHIDLAVAAVMAFDRAAIYQPRKPRVISLADHLSSDERAELVGRAGLAGPL